MQMTRLTIPIREIPPMMRIRRILQMTRLMRGMPVIRRLVIVQMIRRMRIPAAARTHRETRTDRAARIMEASRTERFNRIGIKKQRQPVGAGRCFFMSFYMYASAPGQGCNIIAGGISRYLR